MSRQKASANFTEFGEFLDLGARPNTTRTTNARVVDLVTGTVLIDYGTQTILGSVHSHFVANVSSANRVAVEWRDTGFNVGIDNVDFTAGPAPVPEPASSSLLLIGGIALMGRWVYRGRNS